MTPYSSIVAPVDGPLTLPVIVTVPPWPGHDTQRIWKVQKRVGTGVSVAGIVVSRTIPSQIDQRRGAGVDGGASRFMLFCEIVFRSSKPSRGAAF